MLLNQAARTRLGLRDDRRARSRRATCSRRRRSTSTSTRSGLGSSAATCGPATCPSGARWSRSRCGRPSSGETSPGGEVDWLVLAARDVNDWHHVPEHHPPPRRVRRAHRPRHPLAPDGPPGQGAVPCRPQRPGRRRRLHRPRRHEGGEPHVRQRAGRRRARRGRPAAARRRPGDRHRRPGRRRPVRRPVRRRDRRGRDDGAHHPDPGQPRVGRGRGRRPVDQRVGQHRHRPGPRRRARRPAPRPGRHRHVRGQGRPAPPPGSTGSDHRRRSAVGDAQGPRRRRDPPRDRPLLPAGGRRARTGPRSASRPWPGGCARTARRSTPPTSSPSPTTRG